MKETPPDTITDHLTDVKVLFSQYRKLAEKALEQLSDAEFFEETVPGINSAALVVKHIAGNQRSRWTNFLTEDGEKPDRDRDSEFVTGEEDRNELMRRWDDGWRLVFDTLAGLTAEDMPRSVTIRGEQITVIRAINRQLTHYAYHVGQIVLKAKQFRGLEWRSLSVPKGRSADLNAFMEERARTGDSGEHYLEDVRDFFATEEDE